MIVIESELEPFRKPVERWKIPGVMPLIQECFIFHLLNSYNKPKRLVFYYLHLIDKAFTSIGLRNGKKSLSGMCIFGSG